MSGDFSRKSGPGASDYEEFLRLRFDESVSDVDFANAVLSTPVFDDARRTAGRVLAPHWRHDRIEDALQEAALRMHAYLAATRAVRFYGSTDDELGGWLYALLMNNARWALMKTVRGERRRQARDMRASRRETEAAIPAWQFARTFDRALAMIAALPALERGIAMDMLRGVSARESAAAHGISLRRVYEIRAAILAKVERLLEELP
ncbi:MAG: ECF-type sigma factor [Pirellulaceae bacterium]